MRQYNPYVIARRVRRIEVTEEIIVSVSKSMTKNDGTEHEPVINLQTGMVSCTCGDFEHRCKQHSPNVHTPDFHCKHLKRAIANSQRRGEIAKPARAKSAATDADLMQFFGR